MSPDRSERDVATDFVAGCLTGVMTSILVNPLWVLKVRLAAAAPDADDVFVMLARMVREEGVASLWSGTLVSMLGCLEGATQFLLVEEAKRRQRVGLLMLSPQAMVVVGSLARALSVTMFYPYQSVRSVQQSSRNGFVWERDMNFRTLYSGWLVKMFRELLFGGLFTSIRETMMRE